MLANTKTGVVCVPGLAIGRVVTWQDDPVPRSTAGTLVEERARLERGLRLARSGIVELVRLLPRAEAELFEPELLILDELAATLATRLTDGVRAEDVVDDSTAGIATDLVLDARARILDGIAHERRTVDDHLDGRDGDLVLVIGRLTPSVIASLPARVVGVLSAAGAGDSCASGTTSHAAILARGRDIPLALMTAEEIAEIGDGLDVVVDTLGDVALVSVSPSTAEMRGVEARRRAWAHARAEDEALVAAPLTHLGIRVLANVGSLRERIPASVEGIGLVRTELLFADHAWPPSETEQLGVLCAIAARAPGLDVVVRLFDAGGDKPLEWLPPAEQRPDARGIELLFEHPRVLDAQLGAIARAAAHFRALALVPFVRYPSDVLDVQARLAGRVPVGALIETPEAVARIDDIARVSDFISIGTNDLAACVTGVDRSNAGLSLDPRVLRLVERVAIAARARSRPITVCGEMASDPHGARVLVGLGVEAISLAPARIAPVKVALRSASSADCSAIAHAAMGRS